MRGGESRHGLRPRIVMLGGPLPPDPDLRIAAVVILVQSREHGEPVQQRAFGFHPLAELDAARGVLAVVVTEEVAEQEPQEAALKPGNALVLYILGLIQCIDLGEDRRMLAKPSRCGRVFEVGDSVDVEIDEVAKIDAVG